MKSFVLLLFSVALYNFHCSNGFMIDLPNEKLKNELTIKLKPISAEVKCPMCEFFKFMQNHQMPLPMNFTTEEERPASKPKQENLLPKIPLNPAFMEILNKVGSAFKNAVAIKEKMDEKKLDKEFNITAPAAEPTMKK